MTSSPTVFGHRASATDYELRMDCGLPPDSALSRIAGLRISLGPGKISISPGYGSEQFIGYD
eukprot:15432394-Alexandrium_andersonii.AAC.1